MSLSQLFREGAKGTVSRAKEAAETPFTTTSQLQESSFEADLMREPEQKDSPGWTENMFVDTAVAPVRGVLDMVDGVIDLADTITPFLGDWYDDEFELNSILPYGLGESKTIPGGLVSGATQFLSGFLGFGLGAAGWAGRLPGIAKATQAARLAGPTSKLAKTGKYVVKPMVAGAITDFTAFEGQEERLSDLFQGNESLLGNFTSYLSYTGNEDDTELEGRLKNVIEGLVLEGVVGGTLYAMVKSIKSLRKYKQEKAKGKDPEEAGKAAYEDLKQDDEGQLLFEFDPTEKPTTDVDADPALVDSPFKTRENEVDQVTLNKKTIDKLEQRIAQNQKEFNERETGQLQFNIKETEEGASEMSTPKTRGGDQAVDASYEVIAKSIEDLTDEASSSADTLAVMIAGRQALAKLKNARKVYSADVLNGITQTVAEKSGNVKVSLEKIREGEDVSTHEQWLAENASAYLVMRKSAENVVNVAKKWEGDIYSNEATIEVADALAAFDEAARVNSIRATRDSAGLFYRKVLKRGVKGAFENKRFKRVKSPQPGADIKDYTAFLQERLGQKDIKKLVSQLVNASTLNDVEKITSLKRIARKTAGRKMLDITTEFWINSILSGPTTQIVNVMGNMLTNAMMVGERSIGALLSGDKELAKATIKYAYSSETFFEALKAAAIAFKTDESRLMRGSRQFDESDSGLKERSITAENIPLPGNIRLSNESTLGAAVNFFGNVARVPSRFLVGGDEFFKNMAFRQYLRTEFAMEAMSKPEIAKNGKAIAAYVETEMKKTMNKAGTYYSEMGRILEANRVLDEQGLKYGDGREKAMEEILDQKFDETRSAMAERAARYTRKSTFTSNYNELQVPALESMGNLGATILKAHPELRFIVPFLKTPLNIVNFGLERTPIGLAMYGLKKHRERYRKIMDEGTPQEKAELRGRIATSVLTTAFTLAYVNSNAEFITGAGPQSRQERDILRKAGWQPYSFKTPEWFPEALGGEQYISYQRLDPLATMLTMAADFRDYQKFEIPDDNDENAAINFANMAMIYAVNLTDKTFLKGVNNMFNVLREPEYYGPKLFKDVAAGFIPNIANQLQNTDTEIIVREARTVADATLRRVPGKSKDVAPKRTVLGDVITRDNPGGILGSTLNPFYVSKVKNDAVDNELAKLGHGFKMPSKKLFNIPNIDLTKIASTKGKYDTYDRWMELRGTVKIGNKTLRQRLKDLIGKEGYQKLADEDYYDSTAMKSPKIKAITEIINRYSSKARFELMKETPELQEKYKEAMRTKRDYLQNKL